MVFLGILSLYLMVLTVEANRKGSEIPIWTHIAKYCNLKKLIDIMWHCLTLFKDEVAYFLYYLYFVIFT